MDHAENMTPCPRCAGKGEHADGCAFIWERESYNELALTWMHEREAARGLLEDLT